MVLVRRVEADDVADFHPVRSKGLRMRERLLTRRKRDRVGLPMSMTTSTCQPCRWTTRPNIGMRSALREGNVDSFLTKPVDLRRLCEKIKRLIAA